MTINTAAILFFFLTGVAFWCWQALRMGWKLANSEVLIWRDGQFQQSEHEADGQIIRTDMRQHFTAWWRE